MRMAAEDGRDGLAVALNDKGYPCISRPFPFCPGDNPTLHFSHELQLRFSMALESGMRQLGVIEKALGRDADQIEGRGPGL